MAAQYDSAIRADSKLSVLFDFLLVSLVILRAYIKEKNVGVKIPLNGTYKHFSDSWVRILLQECDFFTFVFYIFSLGLVSIEKIYQTCFTIFQNTY